MVKAIKLYEQILPTLQGKPQSQIVQYNIANALYNIEDLFNRAINLNVLQKLFQQSKA